MIMKKTIIALLSLGSIAFGADAELAWSVDCTHDAYNMQAGNSPINASYSSGNFEQGVGVITAGTAADGSGIALTRELQAINTEFSLTFSLAEVRTSFESDAESQQLTLLAMKKSDGYVFSVLANSQTGAITLNLGNATENPTNNNLSLQGNTSKAQRITLTFGNLEGDSGKALVSVYLDERLAASAEMKAAWRTTDNVTSNLLTGYGRVGVAAVVSEISYYNGALTQSQINELVPEPATATLSLLTLAGLVVSRRRK